MKFFGWFVFYALVIAGFIMIPAISEGVGIVEGDVTAALIGAGGLAFVTSIIEF